MIEIYQRFIINNCSYKFYVNNSVITIGEDYIKINYNNINIPKKNKIIKRDSYKNAKTIMQLIKAKHFYKLVPKSEQND